MLIGLGLAEYQIDALTSRAFNCGVAGGMKGFVKAYKQYGTTEQLYDNLLNRPTTSNGKYAPGLAKRRKAEWDLFCSGYGGNGAPEGEGGQHASIILQKAKQCHDYLRKNGYKYDQVGLNIPITSSVSTIDCSSYVSWVLYEAGFTQFKGHQHRSADFATNPYNWEKISKENLQAGDILVYSGHVEIYAGNGKYYNCGGPESIQHEAPSAYGGSSSNAFKFGLRP